LIVKTGIAHGKKAVFRYMQWRGEDSAATAKKEEMQ